tara:strand:+ start:3036 stop:3362 length:327 start_codon:yes stop_codon:yes gene_type:complete
VKKNLYREFCSNPEARKNNGYTRKGQHFFAGVENSSRESVSTITGSPEDEIIARISTWAGAIEVKAKVSEGKTLFYVSLSEHAGSGDNCQNFCSGIIGDKDSIMFGTE